jgi:CRISPR system Cascade subunit CasE
MLWEAFRSDRQQARPFLFRADVQRSEDGSPRIVCLVQSEVEADWGRLKDMLLDQRQKEYLPRFEPRQRLQFFLRANPTQSRKDRNEIKFRDLQGEEFRKKRGRRVGLRREEEQLAWLRRKATSAGFEVERKLVGEIEQEAVIVTGSRPWRWQAHGHSACHEGVDFQGILRVEDPARLLETVRQGIGPAKALGFGLLSLARAQD